MFSITLLKVFEFLTEDHFLTNYFYFVAGEISSSLKYSKDKTTKMIYEGSGNINETQHSLTAGGVRKTLCKIWIISISMLGCSFIKLTIVWLV